MLSSNPSAPATGGRTPPYTLEALCPDRPANALPAPRDLQACARRDQDLNEQSQYSSVRVPCQPTQPSFDMFSTHIVVHFVRHIRKCIRTTIRSEVAFILQ
jgi:hypothetical protein